MVYLYPASADWTTPDPNDNLEIGRIAPTFTGTIGADVMFFGFPVAPAALSTHWVVLEEPPAGYRFYQQPAAGRPPPPPGVAPTSASAFAYQHFALPVRVLIGQLL